MLRLKLPPVLRSLDRVNAVVRCLAAEAELSEQHTYRLRLAAEELFTNVIRHGCGPTGWPAQVLVEGGLTDEYVWIRFVDTAEPFDPLNAPTSTGIDRLKPDDPLTLGLQLARWAVDEASYVYADGTNQTTIKVSRAEWSAERELTRWC